MYGQKKRPDRWDSSITATRLENENPNSVQDVLRGKLAGLNVGLGTSAKGRRSLEVRGRTPFNAESSPLIVLDGAVYYAGINPNITTITTSSAKSDGCSAFGQTNPRATFTSVAFGWLFTDPERNRRMEWFIWFVLNSGDF